MKALERAHYLERKAAQLGDALGVLLGLVEREVIAQLGLDFGVGGQRLGVCGAKPARRLALGQREVVDALLGHDARRRRRDAGTHAVLSRGIPAAHHRDNSVCIFTSSAFAAPSWADSRRLRARPGIASPVATPTSIRP